MYIYIYYISLHRYFQDILGASLGVEGGEGRNRSVQEGSMPRKREGLKVLKE